MFDLSSVTVDDIFSFLANSKQEEGEKRFQVGEICAYAMGDMNIKAGELAKYYICSAGYIRQLAKTWAAFPTEEDRLPYAELTFEHFKKCAYQNNPKYWADIAADRGLSTRELTRLINGEEVIDDLREADRIFNRVEKCIEAGGRGARYLYEKLTKLIRGVDINGLHTNSEAAETTEEAKT